MGADIRMKTDLTALAEVLSRFNGGSARFVSFTGERRRFVLELSLEEEEIYLSCEECGYLQGPVIWSDIAIEVSYDEKLGIFEFFDEDAEFTVQCQDALIKDEV